MPHGESPTDDYPRLLLALRDAAPGALVFVQLNSPVQRRQLPEKLAADGLQRPFVVADFATFRPGPPPDGVLREFLEEVKSTLPEILFIDGLEHWVEADPKTFDALNLGRERLANLGIVVVFLLPAYLITLIRDRALNLWSWRAHYYSLEPNASTIKIEVILPPLDTGRTIVPGDTPEARDRRIRILQRLLDEGLSEHRTIESLMHSILLPLVRELYDAGRLDEARLTLDQEKISLERDSQDKAAFFRLRALVLQALGNFREAEMILQQALLIDKKILGDDHPEIATNLNNLAVLYYNEGKYAKAQSLLLQALSIEEKTRGLEHVDWAISFSNLALLSHIQGQHQQATSFYKRALAIQEKALGPDHPDVANTLNNLAALYSEQGRNIDAELLCQRALGIWERTLGPEHPDIAHGLNNLAQIFQARGRYDQAESLYQKALRIQEKSLGPEHPDVAYSLNNLGNVYFSQGKYYLTESLCLRALKIKEKSLGLEHPSTAKSLENYAVLLRATTRQAEAEQMEARAQTIRAKHAQENPAQPG